MDRRGGEGAVAGCEGYRGCSVADGESAGKTGEGDDEQDLGGDVLTAHFVRVNGAQHLAEVHGDGHTLLRRVSATGVVNTSSGDGLEVHFGAAAAGHARAAADEIASAVEQGHVVMTQKPVRKPGDTNSRRGAGHGGAGCV